jgi:hypothetical protein
MKKHRLHVMPHRRGWQIKRDGASRASRVLPSKAEAQAEGRALAARNELELVIHGRDYLIQDSDSYGNDPRDRRDTVH